MVIEGESTQNENNEETFEGMKVLKPKVTEQEPIEKQVEEKPIIKEEAPKVNEVELDEERVASWLKTKYADKQFEKLDELFTEKEPVEKIVEKEYKYKDLIDEEDEAYYQYKQETGRSRKEFNYLKENISEKDALELSIDKLKQESGLKLSKEEAIGYLEEELGIDLSDDDAATRNKIALNKYSKSRRDELLVQQEKYREPLEAKLAEKSKANVEMVTLENGKQMPKAEYDSFIEQRTAYLNNIKKAVNSVTPIEVKTVIDDNGDKKELAFSYEYSQEDKHSMLSDASDVDATIKNRFESEDGFNYQGLSETLWRGKPENFNKILSAAIQQTRAEAMEEFIAMSNNENFSLSDLPRATKKTKAGYASPEEVSR